jgi:hypothetical protein
MQPPGTAGRLREVWMGCTTRLTGIALLVWLTLSAAPANALPAASPTLPPPTVRAWQTGLLRPDRLEHASFAFTLGLGVGLLSRRPACAAASALALGMGKEIRDRRHGGFDPVDLAAVAIGAGLAALVTDAAAR